MRRRSPRTSAERGQGECGRASTWRCACRSPSSPVGDVLKGTGVGLGAQDCYYEERARTPPPSRPRCSSRSARRTCSRATRAARDLRRQRRRRQQEDAQDPRGGPQVHPLHWRAQGGARVGRDPLAVCDTQLTEGLKRRLGGDDAQHLSSRTSPSGRGTGLTATPEVAAGGRLHPLVVCRQLQPGARAAADLSHMLNFLTPRHMHIALSRATHRGGAADVRLVVCRQLLPGRRRQGDHPVRRQRQRQATSTSSWRARTSTARSSAARASRPTPSRASSTTSSRGGNKIK